jgi:hypothetical protein
MQDEPSGSAMKTVWSWRPLLASSWRRFAGAQPSRAQKEAAKNHCAVRASGLRSKASGDFGGSFPNINSPVSVA